MDYSYQNHLVEDTWKTMLDKGSVVLAASPGAGKTKMSFSVIDRYLQAFPASRVLVLAHGQRILRSQYVSSLQKETSFSHSFKAIDSFKELDDSRVIIALPQTIQKKALPEFDLIVVDEAHEFFFADTVQGIINRSKAKHLLLLTGTPSRFIANEYPIVAMPMNELIDSGVIEDVMVELANTTYKFGIGDYNEDYELKTNVELSEIDTGATLDALLTKLHERLISVFAGQPSIYNIAKGLTPTWVPALKALEKTLIACRSQKQAEYVNAYFAPLGIDAAISTSDADPESEQVRRFIDDPNCMVLIVVRRAILGFDLPDLVNVVDMTGSQNIDRIFQLLARVVRKHPKGRKKLFFKVVPTDLQVYFEHVMTATLCLTDREWFTKFNGKNFLDLEIPFEQTPLRSPEDQKEGQPCDSKQDAKNTQPRFKPASYLGMPAIRFFRDVLHKNGDMLSTYAFTTMRAVRNALFGLRTTHTYESIRANLSEKKYKNVKTWLQNTSGEYQAAFKNHWLQSLKEEFFPAARTSRTHTYETIRAFLLKSKFKKKVDWMRADLGSYQTARKYKWMEALKAEFFPHSIEIVVAEKKRLIKELFEKNGRFPSRSSNDPIETSLVASFQNYVFPASGTYDASFTEWARNNGYGKDTTIEKKIAIKEFFARHGRLPGNRRSGSDTERRMSIWLHNYSTPTRETFDAEFSAWARESGFAKDTVTEKKSLIKEFVEKNARLPSAGSSNSEEKRLGAAMLNYINPESASYDDSFSKWVAATGYIQGRNKVAENKRLIVQFYENHGRLPLIDSEDAQERKLGRRVREYVRSDRSSYDPEFAIWVSERGYKKRSARKQSVSV